MINYTLLKRELKANYKIILIFIAVLAMYTSVIVWMYGAFVADIGNQNNSLFQMMEQMPELANMFGFSLQSTDYTSFLSSYLYGMIMLIFPLIYIIIMSNKLMTRYIDKGSMAYLLATPNSRKKIAATQMLFYILSTTSILILAGLFIFIESAIKYPGTIDIGKFLLLHFGCLSFHIMLCGIFFAISCSFSESKKTLGLCSSIGIGFYLIDMLSNMGSSLDCLKFLTIFSLFDSNGLLNYEPLSIIFIFLMLLISSISFGLGIYQFSRRDLSI